MNILFISNQNNNKWSGPTYSIPKQVAALAKIDNVFWYNINFDRCEEWERTGCYNNLENYPESKISSLPSPFNKPDVAIVEQFYPYGNSGVFNELIKSNIKYVIIPRGELTHDAQRRKKLKKTIANYILFYRYAKKAAAIIYLTENEKKQSGIKWNDSSVVIGNGIDMPRKTKDYSSLRNGIKCVAIGRMSPYQKGLDLLLEACILCKHSLINNHCSIDLYGPDYDNQVYSLRQIVAENGLENTIHFHEGVFGEEKQRVLLECDVYLMPSRFEGHPMALIEALSYGLPCIVTEGSNMRDEVDKYHAGWTSENTVEGIRTSLQKMIESTSDFEQFGSNARRLAGLYNWEKVADETHNQLERIIRGYNNA